jgi:hypothetical protein
MQWTMGNKNRNAYIEIKCKVSESAETRICGSNVQCSRKQSVPYVRTYGTVKRETNVYRSDRCVNVNFTLEQVKNAQRGEERYSSTLSLTLGLNQRHAKSRPRE